MDLEKGFEMGPIFHLFFPFYFGTSLSTSFPTNKRRGAFESETLITEKPKCRVIFFLMFEECSEKTNFGMW